ncbi:MAG TPA: glycosyltransferase family 4 protein [Candidatus Binataceae bacterium]|jgi:UDP-glucose:(heptosyl)LPS alpha-1,3-glucosyltransferase|nr:glycosyltransferase family 4 protein [Candidatus Binataceae bacterium]
MRIALVTRRFDPAGGGTERDLMITARLLVDAGHRVTIYAEEVRAATNEWPVRRVASRGLGRALGLLWFARAAAATARREGTELVLSFARIMDADVLRSGGGAHSSYVRAASRWQSGPARWAMRISPYHRVQRLVERRGFESPRLKCAIAVSNLVRDDLMRTFALAPERAVTLYNGVELDRFKTEADAAARGAIRREFGVNDARPAVLFVGNGFARKGLRFLIEAWPAVTRDAWLIVVGADQAAAAYERLAGRLGLTERIKFLGRRSDVARLMRGADVLALPSLFEPFGNVALEAMASGAPALTTVFCGVAEVMPEGLRLGVVNNPANHAELVERMNRLIEAAPALRGAARAAAEPFTWERHGRELLEIVAAAADGESTSGQRTGADARVLR